MTYSIMPKCDCSKCSRRSATKCNLYREDNYSCSCKRSPKRKHTSYECKKCKPVTCECKKCKQHVKPTCKCEDYANSDNDNNDSDHAADCNTQTHQFIISVKTTN